MSGAEASSSKNEQLIEGAKQLAEQILSGVVSPYEGGRRIWWEYQLKLADEDHRLDPFVYWASEYEETTDKDRRALCDTAIRKAAASLVDRGSAL